MTGHGRYVKWVRCGGGHTVMCLSPTEEEGEEEGGEEQEAIEWRAEQKEEREGGAGARAGEASPRLTARQEEKLSESRAGM
jgi:hypothetical protein